MERVTDRRPSSGMASSPAGLNSIEIVEVSPRDGLQNESQAISTADKLNLIRRAIDAGVRRIEVTSFVNHRKVPQLADAEAVVAGLPDRADITFVGLVLNERGAKRAIAAGVDQLGAVCVATDEFSLANQGQSSDLGLETAIHIQHLARSAGLSGQITIGAAFGCPFSGDVDPSRVIAMAERAAHADPVEVALADTIGVAVPSEVTELVTAVRKAISPIPVRVHFHNTRNTGIANVWAAVRAGARTVDASLGGIGGCPFAPGAAGNVATEDVVYLLNRSGVVSGLDLPDLVASARWLENVLGKKLPGMVAAATPLSKVTPT